MKKGILSILSAVAGAGAGAFAVGKVTGKAIQDKQKMSDKHLALFLLMNQWVKVKQEGKSLDSYFKENGYHEIAVYGMSYAGETLVNELVNTDIKVKYGIDKNADRIYSDVNVVSMEDKLEKVDVIVVSAVFFFEEIRDELEKKMNCPIISLEDILYEV